MRMLSISSGELPFLVYVDDDEDDLFFVRESIEPYLDRINFHTFSYPPNALSFLKEKETAGQKPSLLIFDMNMHGITGKDLLVRVRQQSFYDDVPVVLFTTSSMMHDYRFALQHNASFLTKPMHYDQMRLIAEEFIRLLPEEIKSSIQSQ